MTNAFWGSPVDNISVIEPFVFRKKTDRHEQDEERREMLRESRKYLFAGVRVLAKLEMGKEKVA